MKKKDIEVEWFTEKRKVSDLKFHPRNPRTLSKKSHDDLLRSFNRFNYAELVAINKDNTILAGHQRISIMKELGWEDKEIEVRVPNVLLSKRDADGYLLISNKVSGDWDMDIMANQWEMEELIEGGFTQEELYGDYDMKPSEEESEEKEEPEIPEAESKSNTLQGDIFEMNGHKLICGSSTDPEVIKRLFDGQKCDLIVTDPPYNVNYQGKTKDALKIENDSMDDSSFYQFLFDAYKNMFDFIKEGGSIYVFHADTEGVNFRKAFKDVGFKLSECLVWVKNTFVLGRQDYHWQHEPCLYGWKEGEAHKWYSDRKQTTVLNFDKPSRNGEHPTMKPLNILMYLIQNSSKREDLVFDPFLGSGSTLMASEQSGRICYGCELSPNYCDVIVKRFKNYMEQENIPYFIKKNGKDYKI